MYLTTEERNKFAAWLEERAHENRQLCGPLREIGGAIMEQVAKQNEALAIIFEHTAKYLRSIQSETVAASPSPSPSPEQEKCSHCENGELLKGGQRCTYCGRGCGKPAAPAGEKGEEHA